MNKKLTIEEIRKLADSKQLPLKPKPVKIPENIKKYDKIYMLLKKRLNNNISVLIFMNLLI